MFKLLYKYQSNEANENRKNALEKYLNDLFKVYEIEDSFAFREFIGNR